MSADQHSPLGECCVGRAPGPGERLIEFNNIYEDGTEVDVRHAVSMLTPAEYAALTPDEVAALAEDDVPVDTYEEYQRELLWRYTGTGKCEGDAGYFARSVDGLTPVITEEWC